MTAPIIATVVKIIPTAPVLDDSFVTPREPGERPLRGATLLEYVRDNYPENCGYTFRGWSNQDTRNFRPNIEAVAQGRLPRCHESNCSTATYLALVEAIRGTEHEARLRDQLHTVGTNEPHGLGSYG